MLILSAQFRGYFIEIKRPRKIAIYNIRNWEKKSHADSSNNESHNITLKWNECFGKISNYQRYSPCKKIKHNTIFAHIL